MPGLNLTEILFMDDSVMWNDSVTVLETRIGQLARVFAEWGLELNAEKAQWYPGPYCKHAGAMTVKGVAVKPAPALEVMGLKLTVNMTASELVAPLMAKARDTFWSLKHLLLRRGNVKHRLRILQTVVGGARLWCVASLTLSTKYKINS